MKYMAITLLAFVLAVATVAFTRTNNSPKSGIYWFPVNETTGEQIPQLTQPVSMAADPYGCLMTAPKFCSRSYSTYLLIPGSSPALYKGMTGSEMTTHYKY